MNWTNWRLREALHSRGITYPSNARRSVCVRLYTDSEFPGSINWTSKASARSHNHPHQKINVDSSERWSGDAPYQYNNGHGSVHIRYASVAEETYLNKMSAQKLPGSPYEWSFQKDVVYNFNKRITTPIIIDSLQSLLQNHPDINLSEYIING